jgi:hypothetical protein
MPKHQRSYKQIIETVQGTGTGRGDRLVTGEGGEVEGAIGEGGDLRNSNGKKIE